MWRACAASAGGHAHAGGDGCYAACDRAYAPYAATLRAYVCHLSAGCCDAVLHVLELVLCMLRRLEAIPLVCWKPCSVCWKCWRACKRVKLVLCKLQVLDSMMPRALEAVDARYDPCGQTCSPHPAGARYAPMR